jgi:hypothetical protein
MADDANKLFENLQTLPGLIGELGLSIAVAQQRLDENYLENLVAFANLALPIIQKSDTQHVAQFLELFKSVAPSRYQFTETTVEVRADLQMASAQEIGISGSVKLSAVAINASYTKRTAYDYQAAAHIRTVLHAIPASDVVLDKLLAASNTAIEAPKASKDRLEGLIELLKGLPKPGTGTSPDA